MSVALRTEATERAGLRAASIAALLGAMLVVGPARAERTVSSVMFVSKSENKNQVHYGVHLADDCTFAGNAPVYAYWRMLEKGPMATEPLLDREQKAYGIERQDVHGDTARVTLHALPGRVITVRVGRAADGTCGATAETTIGGHAARLFNVHVALGFLHVDHLLIQGWAQQGGALTRERVEM
jgi:hypothetical protein